MGQGYKLAYPSPNDVIPPVRLRLIKVRWLLETVPPTQVFKYLSLWESLVILTTIPGYIVTPFLKINKSIKITASQKKKWHSQLYCKSNLKC